MTETKEKTYTVFAKSFDNGSTYQGTTEIMYGPLSFQTAEAVVLKLLEHGCGGRLWKEIKIMEDTIESLQSRTPNN
jgi:hypothetical protein